MIAYWVHHGGRAGVQVFLEGPGAPLSGAIVPRHYEDLAASMPLGASAHVFSALDQLGGAQLEAVAAIHDQVAQRQPGVRLLNDPRRTLLRYDLLARLFELGINRFRAYHWHEIDRVQRYPVFVRAAAAHTGNLTSLLRTPRDLRRALLALRARGYPARNLLIVEYCDTSDDTGRFWKYAAFKIGDAIIARHLMVGTHWMVKGPTQEPTVESARCALAYVSENPHEPWLRRIFEIAGVDYGRIDYSMSGDSPQVWEINLHPTLVGARPDQRPPRPPEVQAILDQQREVRSAQLMAAWRGLDDGSAPAPVTVTLSPALIDRIAAERSRARRRRQLLARLQRVADSRLVGGPCRWLYRRLLPRR